MRRSKSPQIHFQNRALQAGVAVLCVLAVVVGIYTLEGMSVQAPAVVPQDAPISGGLEPVTGEVLSRAEPVTLRIPKINLTTSFVSPLGLLNNGEVEVPDSFSEVGWYQHSPTPGELGPAVVLGHVDSVDGPAVFFSLGQLESGDEVLIDRADGSIARFIVERLERYEQIAFPTLEVYGNIDYAGLRLITCSGTYERGRNRYSHNLVVYARLAPDTQNGSSTVAMMH